MLNRRELIHAGCTIAAATLVSPIDDGAEAETTLNGSAPAQLSKRNIINVNDISFILNEYAFIDHVRQGAGIMSPFGGSAFSAGAPWNTLLDAEGWPNKAAANGASFGGRIQVPDPKNFSGPYIVDWEGNGVVGLNIVGEVGTTKAASLQNCRVLAASGASVALISTGGASKASARITFSGTTPGPQGIFLVVSSTGASGIYVKNVRFYRAEDAADIASGLIFRRAWKQPLVDLCPSAIRFMNWLGGNNDRNCRFENRTLPSNAGYVRQNQWLASPAYGEASGVNQFTLPAATPTAGNPRTTPTAMIHGEVVTCRLANGIARCAGSNVAANTLTISAITNANPGKVTTATPHGFNTGDVIIHNDPTGMPKLNLFPCTITVTSPTEYTIGIDTTSFGTFSVRPVSSANQYISLNVGGRGAFPIVFAGGSLSASAFGSGYVNSLDYKTFYFDKTVSGSTDGAGNQIPGAWLVSATPLQTLVGHSGDVPIEVCVALVNELNAMSPAHTIGMWMNVPAWGLSSMDPDYTVESDWAINAVDVVMNPSSKVRSSGFSALGYSGATQLNRPVLIIEYSNEVWNGSVNDAKGWLINRAIQRWPTIKVLQNGNNFQDMHALRSTCMARDIKAALPPGLPRIKFVIGMWGFVGISASGDFGGNYATVFGGTFGTPAKTGDWYTNDAEVVRGGWGKPIDNHDGVTVATYFEPPDSYYSARRGTGTFTDDSAMFNGADNSGNGGGNYRGIANEAQAITNFVTQVINTRRDGGSPSQSITQWATVLMPQFASIMPSGKIVINYEGGTDWNATDTFSMAVINSPQWASAQVDFFDAIARLPNCFMPSIYIWVQGAGSQRWAYCTPDTYALISGAPMEGAALTTNSPVWIAMGNRNRALPN